MGDGKRLELPHRLDVPPERELGVDARLERRQAQLLQACDLAAARRARTPGRRAAARATAPAPRAAASPPSPARPCAPPRRALRSAPGPAAPARRQARSPAPGSRRRRGRASGGDARRASAASCGRSSAVGRPTAVDEPLGRDRPRCGAGGEAPAAPAASRPRREQGRLRRRPPAGQESGIPPSAESTQARARRRGERLAHAPVAPHAQRHEHHQQADHPGQAAGAASSGCRG